MQIIIKIIKQIPANIDLSTFVDKKYYKRLSIIHIYYKQYLGIYKIWRYNCNKLEIKHNIETYWWLSQHV